jgi:hypothetical protein
MGMMGGQDMGMGMGMGMERVFPCVRLRGLPFDVTEDEIRIFLVSIQAAITSIGQLVSMGVYLDRQADSWDSSSTVKAFANIIVHAGLVRPDVIGISIACRAANLSTSC